MRNPSYVIKTGLLAARAYQYNSNIGGRRRCDLVQSQGSCRGLTLRYLGHEKNKNIAVGKQDLNLFPANDRVTLMHRQCLYGEIIHYNPSYLRVYTPTSFVRSFVNS